MLTFQHCGTARHRDSEYCISVRLYGRCADGKSVAVTVNGVTAYGFVGVRCDQAFQRRVATLLQWWLSMQRTTQSTKKYKKENDEVKPMAKIFDQWKTWWFPKCEVFSIKWSKHFGHNIRSVVPGKGPEVWRFEVAQYEHYRGLLQMFRSPSVFYNKVVEFRNKMANYSDIDYPLPASVEPYLTDSSVYETMFKPEIVWMVDHQLPACSWMNLSNAVTVFHGSSCDLNFTCSATDVTPCHAPPIPMAPFRVLSYDIEAVPFINAAGDCEFPDPIRDSIVTIGVAAFDIVSAVMHQTVFMLENENQQRCTTLAPLTAELQTDEYDPSITRVLSFISEAKMLAAFTAFIRKYDPDVITGYNVLNFDNLYFLRRVQALCGCPQDSDCSDCASARTFSRINRPSTLKKKYTHSKQRGGQETWEAWIEGRDWMDVYRVVMSDHKLRSYKLDNVCQELLGTKKIHISYDDIPLHQETPSGREFLAQYCVKDAWLPCQIIVKRCKLVNALQMSQVTGVPLSDILHRGQQIRTLLLMLQFVKARCRKDSTHPRWYLPDESGKSTPPMGGFEGAVVIRPLPGFYQTPVVTLDFASLYPSIMRAYNMCFSTLIPSMTEAKRQNLKWSPETHDIKDPKDPNYPEVRPVRSFDYPEGGKFEYVPRDTDICFVTPTTRLGILPEILEHLLSERSRIKKLRKQYGEKTMDYAVLDGRQLALKVCANSAYGFTGAGMGYLGEKRIASSVTRVGRGMANHTKFMCEEEYKEHGLQIVYGDSVIGSTPLLLRVNGNIVVCRIESLGDKWSAYHNGKESCELSGVESWTDTGWTTVQRVIRHACNKKLVHVATHTGNIVCTTDHSLVRASGEEVAPKQAKIGDDLMHHCPLDFPAIQHEWSIAIDMKLVGIDGLQFDNLKDAATHFKCDIDSVTRKWCQCVLTTEILHYTPQMAQLLGMFVGGGSCSTHGTDSSWTIKSANMEMLKECKTIAQNIFPGFVWEILPKSSGVFKLVPTSSKYGNLRRMVSFWRRLCYNNKHEKIIDDCVLQSSLEHRQYFWKGLHDADGTKGCPEISQKGREISLSIVILLRSLGYAHVVIDTIKPNIYRMKAQHTQTPRCIQKISDWNHDEVFVYDLTTENHHFHAGVGTLIVHNTDSVFAEIPASMCDTNCSREELVRKVDEIGKKMGEFCTKAFLPPNDLEYEKFYYPILLKGKKRYAGHKFEPGLAPKLDVKGFECVRRDFAPIVSKTQKEVLVRLCKHNDVQGAINYARQVVVQLLENKVSVEDLTMSKQLTRRPEEYKNPAPHTELAKKLQATQPAHIAPKTGDRIPYLIRPGYKGEKTCMRAVTPEDVAEGREAADTRWYLNHQLQQPLQRIFEMVMENSTEIFEVTQTCVTQTINNPTMQAFVQQQPRDKRKKREQSQIQMTKKRKAAPPKDIRSFFT